MTEPLSAHVLVEEKIAVEIAANVASLHVNETEESIEETILDSTKCVVQNTRWMSINCMLKNERK
jgi:hypothetical protein